MYKSPKETACSGFINGKFLCKHGFIQNRGCCSNSIEPCGCRTTIPNCLNEEIEGQPRLDKVGI